MSVHPYPDIAVIIPTCRRPEGLERALDSVVAQIGVAAFHIVVVDNDPAGSASSALAARRARCPGLDLRIVHEPRPGVSNARNAGLAATGAGLIAWLDDDQAAPPGWLAALLHAHVQLQADVVFGPVWGHLPPGVSPHRRYFEGLYSRRGPSQTGPTAKTYGIGNALTRRAGLLDGPLPFDPAANDSGGEDDILFARARAIGARFAWAADAGVTEHIDPGRACVSHAVRRAFAYGAGPSRTAWTANPPDIIGGVRHGVVGLAQLIGFGGLAGIGFATRRPWRLWALDRAMRGLGKLAFRVRLQFYGTALISAPDRPPATPQSAARASAAPR
jgi:hypothetical protein